MDLPLTPPLDPMLAKAATAIPTGDGYAFEPKWDGFRAIVFRDGDEIEVQSRGGKSLGRYMPELVDALLSELPDRCVVDGEIVIVGPDGGLDFDALQARIHPAESRIAVLAEATPTSFVTFDLLALDSLLLLDEPFSRRRGALESILEDVRSPIHLTPQTRDVDQAQDWFDRFEGAGLDGVLAKPIDGRYEPGKRAVLKVKHGRTADCVVAGYRMHKDGAGVGSLLLGLYDDAGVLHSVGSASSFSAARRAELLDELAPYVVEDMADHPWAGWDEQTPAPPRAARKASGTAGGDDPGLGQRLPGAPSRWSGGKDASFTPMRPDLVAEVAYDQLQGNRFRHVARLLRWRPDRDPASCTYSQLEVVPPVELIRIFQH